jgi:hypothetical protein
MKIIICFIAEVKMFKLLNFQIDPLLNINLDMQSNNYYAIFIFFYFINNAFDNHILNGKSKFKLFSFSESKNMEIN